jgi:antitoxin HigA-1
MTSKSSTTTKRRAASSPRKGFANDRLTPIHPGEVLREEFLLPLSLSVYRVAKDIGIPSQRLNDVVLERRALSADTAIRLARYFGTSEHFWMSLQATYDLDIARDSIASIDDIRAFASSVSTAPRSSKSTRVTTVVRDAPRSNARTHKK